MKRRTYLVGLSSIPLSGGAAVVANEEYHFLDHDPSDQQFSPTAGEHIRDFEFELLEPNDGNVKSNLPEGGGQDFAQVEFDRVSNSVAVSGQATGGGCAEIELKRLSYDNSNDELTVEIFEDLLYDDDDVCTASIEVVPYRLTVDFESEFPSNVTVAHLKDGSGSVYSKRLSVER